MAISPWKVELSDIPGVVRQRYEVLEGRPVTEYQVGAVMKTGTGLNFLSFALGWAMVLADGFEIEGKDEKVEWEEER